MVVLLLIASALGPAVIVTAAPTLPEDTVVKGTLSAPSERHDYNFTAQPGEWTLVASNQYAGSGTLRHGLRTNITNSNPFVYVNIGDHSNTRGAGVIAINGYDLTAPTDYTISERQGTYTPSYALQLRRGMTTISRSSQTIPGDLGPEGVVVGYEINLLKRDTLDLRLRVPPEWTYNYHFSMMLFSPTARYHQFDGQGGTHPVAVSMAGENREQALTYLAMDPGIYCIVLLNEGTIDQVQYELEVGLNGLRLNNGDMDEETLTDVNKEDYYSFRPPLDAWSAAVVKLRGDVDFPVTHSLHWPTPDSNNIAYDTVSDADPVGIVAMNGYEFSNTSMYYSRELYDDRGEDVSFTIQFAATTAVLPPGNATTGGNLTSSDLFVLYEIDLEESETVDIRLQVADYNYDYDLGLYVFPPGDKYYSISGELPDYASGPLAWSRAGKNTEQDAVFTCPRAGVYAIAIVNFAERDDIPFTIEVVVQGKALADDSPHAGDLNAQNTQDLFQFVADRGSWNVVGSRVTSEDGFLTHSLHSTALDTNPIEEVEVGWLPEPRDRPRDYVLQPMGLLAVDGNELSFNTRYYVRQQVVEGSPLYVLELENTPRNLIAADDVISANFRDGEFLQTFTIDLQPHESLDVRVGPSENYTYPYELGLYVLEPGSLHQSVGPEGGAAAMAAPGGSRNPSLVFVAEEAGTHLVVVANLGPMTGLDYELTYAVDGFPAATGGLSEGRLDPDNDQDGYRFNVPTGDWTVVVVRLPEAEPAASLEASIRWPSLDSVALVSAVLTEEDPVAAFLINGGEVPVQGSRTHFVDIRASVPDERTLSYQVHVSRSRGIIIGGTQNMTENEIGALYTQSLAKGSTVDLALRAPPEYTYAYDLGLYVFSSAHTYLSTHSMELGPQAWSRDGPQTEQEVVVTSRTNANLAVLVLNHGQLDPVSFNLTATVDGRLITEPARGYVDEHNQNEHYRFNASANRWNALAARFLSGDMGSFDLKLLSNGLSTNPVVTDTVDETYPTGVIAINGWEFDEPTKDMYANISYRSGYSAFVVHAVTDFTDFGAIGRMESDAFGEDHIIYIYQVSLTVGDHLEIQVDYDEGNWSSDVVLDLLVFEPMQSLGSSPINTMTLRVVQGIREKKGEGTLIANKTGTYAFVLVNRGPLGPMGFELGIYRRSVVNEAPQYPVILKVESSEREIKIEWAPNQEADFEKYEIYLSESASDPGNRIDTITTQSLAKYTIERLDPDHTYYVSIVVYDTEGLYTPSVPKKVSTKELPIWAEPIVLIIIAVVIAAVVAIILIDRGIRWQKAKAAAAPAMAPGAEAPGAEVETEGLEVEAAPAREARPARAVDEGTQERAEAIDFMKEMMGD
jgi:hypothetical protein